MKKYLFTLAILFIGVFSYAQEKASPPSTASGTIGETTVTINYSQPGVKGRTIWGELVPFGKVWRAGANETTTFEVSNDVMIEGKELKAGKYGFYIIPNESEWTIILNTGIGWGAYDYDESKDVLRFNVPVQNLEESMERLTYYVKEEGMVKIKWDKVKVSFTVK